jgi:tetratricopeptide (TPR) repeat protein
MPRDEAKAQMREIERFDARNMVCCTVELARRYLVAHPKNWVVWLYYADSLNVMARYTESLAALRRAARLCPPKRLHFVYYRFGNLHRNRGAFYLSERWYRRAVDASPSDAGYHHLLGVFLARAGRLEEAEAVLRRAIRCKGCISEVFLNLGLVLRALERYPDARKCLQRALDIDPKYKEARKELSDIEHVMELIRNA